MSSPELVGKHVEKWVAVVGKKIVASGDSAADVLRRAKELHPHVEPFIAKFPKETVLLL